MPSSFLESTIPAKLEWEASLKLQPAEKEAAEKKFAKPQDRKDQPKTLKDDLRFAEGPRWHDGRLVRESLKQVLLPCHNLSIPAVAVVCRHARTKGPRNGLSGSL